jgi:hypothetical protein
MKTLKLSFLFLVAVVLMTSCKDEVTDPAEAYIGEWTLVDVTGDGTVSIDELGYDFETKIALESSDAYMHINADNTLESGGQLMITMDLYLEGTLVSSDLTDLGELEGNNVWSLDSNDNFQSPEFDESNAIEFDENIMTLTTNESIDMNGIQVDQEIVFFYEKTQ